jgi:hypothetical protein
LSHLRPFTSLSTSNPQGRFNHTTGVRQRV